MEMSTGAIGCPVGAVGDDEGAAIEETTEAATTVVVLPVVVDDCISLGNVVVEELVVDVWVEASTTTA